MNPAATPPDSPANAEATEPVAVPAASAVAPAAVVSGWRVAVAVAGLFALIALGLAWSAQQRVGELETELVKRQQLSAEQAADARAAARQAQEVARDAAAKMALLELRVAESSIQRSQVEELMQSVARSRDENLLADVDNAIRVALQQSAITGSASPLLATLRQIDERLARYSQPQLERVRRAVNADMERVKAAAVADLSSMTIRLDEAVRQVDELPLLATPERSRAPARPAQAASAPATPPAPLATWSAWLREAGHLVWSEVRALVRVTPIEYPEAVLVAPEQAFFLRENLKLRLLNARLAILSRQFDAALADLREARATLERYFDPGSRKVQATVELLRQVAGQTRQVELPRPDATLAAVAAAAAGR